MGHRRGVASWTHRATMRAAMATSRESKHQARKVDQGGRRKGERETTARDREMRFVFTFVYLSLFAASQNESSERVFDENAGKKRPRTRERSESTTSPNAPRFVTFFLSVFFFLLSCSLSPSFFEKTRDSYSSRLGGRVSDVGFLKKKKKKKKKTSRTLGRSFGVCFVLFCFVSCWGAFCCFLFLSRARLESSRRSEMISRRIFSNRGLFSFSLFLSVLRKHTTNETVSGTVRPTRSTMGNHSAISERSNRSAVHGTMAKTFGPERGERELEDGGGREVEESVRDARGEVGVHRARYGR